MRLGLMVALIAVLLSGCDDGCKGDHYYNMKTPCDEPVLIKPDQPTSIWPQ